jgi:hypothetical protein
VSDVASVVPPAGLALATCPSFPTKPLFMS